MDAPGDSVQVLLKVYTVAGRLIRTLRSEGGLAQVQIPWDGLDAEGSPLATGAYLFPSPGHPEVGKRAGRASASGGKRAVRGGGPVGGFGLPPGGPRDQKSLEPGLPHRCSMSDRIAHQGAHLRSEEVPMRFAINVLAVLLSLGLAATAWAQGTGRPSTFSLAAVERHGCGGSGPRGRSDRCHVVESGSARVRGALRPRADLRAAWFPAWPMTSTTTSSPSSILSRDGAPSAWAWCSFPTARARVPTIRAT